MLVLLIDSHDVTYMLLKGNMLVTL
jgi:hypothetical protein